MTRVWVAGLAWLCACGREGGGALGVALHDSAGVRVVEVRGTAAELDRGWGLRAVPELTTGAAGVRPELELFRVAGVHRFSDGRLLIANGGSGELLLLDSRTGNLRRYGRTGRGPGEFSLMSGLWPGRGDTAWVYDMDLSRVTPFTVSGGFGSPVPVPAGTIDGLVTLRGRFADGAYLGVVVRGFTSQTHGAGARADSMTVVRVASGTEPVALARLPFTLSFVFVSGGGRTITSVPFTAGGAAAAWPGGYWLGETGRYELRRYARSGRLEMVIRRDVAPLRVTPADVEREAVSATGGGRDLATARRLLAEMPIPNRFPAFSRVVASSDGGLWVQDHPGGDEAAPAPWTAFGPDGRIVGRVTLPRGARLVEASGDRLAAVVKDEDEVEHVVLYRLRPARRDGGR